MFVITTYAQLCTYTYSYSRLLHVLLANVSIFDSTSENLLIKSLFNEIREDGILKLKRCYYLNMLSLLQRHERSYCTSNFVYYFVHYDTN